jgi:HPt (histidine-containing phosphotransfer) domain-containing protein
VDDATFGPLRERFRARCVADLARVRAALSDPELACDPAFHMSVHQLAGLAGSLGFHELGAVARVVDEHLVAAKAASSDQLRRLEAALAQAAA